MADVGEVLQRLNAQPFNKNLTLIAFDQTCQNPRQLIQLLNDVLSEISADHLVDLRDESGDATAKRIFDALCIFNYRFPNDNPAQIQQSIQFGDRNLIVPMLAWLLQRLAPLKTRAYLAKFLVPLDVPEDMQQDELYLQYREKLEEFKETHKEVQNVRESGQNFHEIKNELTSLNTERDTLSATLDRQKRKVIDVPQVSKLLETTELLRNALGEKKVLAEQIADQRQRLLQTRAAHQRADQAHQELISSTAGTEAGGEAYLARMIEDLKTNRYLVNEELPNEITQKRQWLSLLKEVLQEGNVNEQSRAGLQQNIAQLRREAKMLQEKRDSLRAPGDEELTLYKQQATVVERRKDEMMARLSDLKNEREAAEVDYQEILKEYEVAGVKVTLQGPELEKFLADVKLKSNAVRNMKGHLAKVRTELGILTRTREILESRDPNIEEFREEIAKQGEVMTTQGKIEMLSQQKQEMDEAKGDTLKEISKIVTGINESIKSQRAKLAPLVKELRAVRGDYNELEGRYLERKGEYEKALLQMESETMKIRLEKDDFVNAWVSEESKYHENIIDKSVLLFQEKKLDNLSEGEPFLDAFQKKLKEEARVSDSCRQRQKNIKETLQPNMRQREYFTDLKSLLEAKINLCSSNRTIDRGVHEGAADRLVIG